MLENQNDSHSENAIISQNDGQSDLTERLLTELSSAIQNYSGTLSSLSAKTKVDPKTIRKIFRGEYKRSPNADTVQRILAVISKERSLKGIANFYGGAIDSYLRSSFSQFFLEDAKTEAEELDSLTEKITDKYSYYSMKLLSCYKEGLNKFEYLEYLTKFIIKNEDDLFHSEISDDLISLFKPIATHKLEYYKRTELINEDREKGTVSLNYKGGHIRIPFEMMQKYEGTMFSLSEPEYWDSLEYFSFATNMACSKEDAKKIIRVMYYAYQESYEILSNSKSNEVPLNLISSVECLKYHKKKDVK